MFLSIDCCFNCNFTAVHNRATHYKSETNGSIRLNQTEIGAHCWSRCTRRDCTAHFDNWIEPEIFIYETQEIWHTSASKAWKSVEKLLIMSSKCSAHFSVLRLMTKQLSIQHISLIGQTSRLLGRILLLGKLIHKKVMWSVCKCVSNRFTKCENGRWCAERSQT